MIRPLASFLHRSGLLQHLRTQWRADDAALRQALKEHAVRSARDSAAETRSAMSALVARQQAQIAELRSQLRDREADPRLDDLALQVRRLANVLAFNAEHRERLHAGAFDLARIHRHIDEAVDRAALCQDPAPHVIVESLLPGDTYRALLDAIPPESCFSQRDATKQNFKPRRQSLAPEYSTETWALFEQAIVTAALLPALLRLFEPHLAAAYGEKYGSNAAAVAALPLKATGGRLMLRRPGYHLDPHLDPRRVLVTCLVYFAHPGDDESFGTQFFRIAQPPAIDRTNTYYPEVHGYACELVRTVPFRSNVAIAFLNHGLAHGADIPAAAPAATRRYAYQFYVAPDPDAVAAIVGGPADAD